MEMKKYASWMQNPMISFQDILWVRIQKSHMIYNVVKFETWEIQLNQHDRIYKIIGNENNKVY